MSNVAFSTSAAIRQIVLHAHVSPFAQTRCASVSLQYAPVPLGGLFRKETLRPLSKRLFHLSQKACFSSVTPSHNRRRSTTGRPSSRTTRTLTPTSTLPTALRSTHDGISTLPQSEIRRVFGLSDITADVGNRILRVLHHRRITGSLVDVGFKLTDAYSHIPFESLEKALGYLRQNYPVDEEAAAEAWVEQEAAKLEESYIKRGQTLGLYKPLDEGNTTSVTSQRRKADLKTTERQGPAGPEQSRAGHEIRPGELRTGKVFGSNPRDSVLEELQKVHKRRDLWEKQEQEKLASQAEKLGGVQTTDDRSSVALPKDAARQLRQAKFEKELELKRQKNEEWVNYYRQRAIRGQESDAEAASTNIFIRNLPITAFAITVIAVCIGGTLIYEPPSQSERIFPSIPLANCTLGLITAANALVYLLWRFPPAWAILNKYFTCVPAAPIAFSILGNTISHNTVGHLIGNMAALWLFGLELHLYVGRADFLAIYISGGISGALFSLWIASLRGITQYYHLGASGCIWAIMVAWATVQAYLPLRRDDQSTYVADLSRFAVIGLNILQHFQPFFAVQWDLFAHLGGAAVGFGWAEILRRQSKLDTKDTEVQNEGGDRAPATESKRAFWERGQ